MGECGIEITNSQTGNWSITEGKAVTEAWLKESTEVDGIFAQNDEMGLGAIEALKGSGPGAGRGRDGPLGRCDGRRLQVDAGE